MTTNKLNGIKTTTQSTFDPPHNNHQACNDNKSSQPLKKPKACHRSTAPPTFAQLIVVNTKTPCFVHLIQITTVRDPRPPIFAAFSKNFRALPNVTSLPNPADVHAAVA